MDAERTVVISSTELLDHTVLTRKKHELVFKKDFLLRSGAKDGDLHLKAIDDEIAHVSDRLSPVEEKLATADMITLVPNRKEIEECNSKIGGYSRVELDAAVRGKKGEIYELMKKRAVLVRNNFDRREDVVRLTIMLNNMPRKEGESLRALIENGAGEDADVSFLPKESQQELVNLASHLGRDCCIFAGSFSLDKKKVDASELKPVQDVLLRMAGGKDAWVRSDRRADFEKNERTIAELIAKIQAKTAEKQARQFNEEESAYFDKLQTDYIEAKERRKEFMPGFDQVQTAKVYRKNLGPAQNEWH